MAEFVVKIADDRGHTHEQVEQGYSVAEVRDRFASQGYLVHWVKPQGLLTSGFSTRRTRKIKQSSFLVFNQQFLTLIKAGLPILNSLDLLIKRQKDANLRSILENVRERVKGGELLSDAFSAHSMVPKIYTTTLMAGEKSADLASGLRAVPCSPRMETISAAVSRRAAWAEGRRIASRVKPWAVCHRYLVVDAMENHRLDFSHILRRISRTFFADPAAFQPAVWHQVRAPERRPIDHHGAGLHLASEA